ncbi:MAG: transcription termination factor Rho [Armatimonadetes bacterium]|nr:transcription termination factor Rho [Armatimonadota bacterium]MBS1711739.1 transcription termination factor Rho [Armatimonadota bacterium]MBX3109707.1 transcription termination factor Rho [Fimbriimonadaceae bacterium]
MRRRSRSDRPRDIDSADLENLPAIDYNHFDQLTPTELAKLAKKHKISIDQSRSKVIEELMIVTNAEHGAIYKRGILEILNEGWGFLRQPSYQPSNEDVYVGQNQVKKNGLKAGDLVFAQVRPPKEGDKYQGVLRVESINGNATQSPENQVRRDFESLTPLFPDEQLKMETVPDRIIGRIVDLIAPIGKGQRGLIVAPPKAGKTTIVKAIAQAVAENDPEVALMVLLVDERPEEVTDMRRFVRGQVISSTFDEPAENHMRVTDLCLEQAKRMVESGRDVVILLDSITRLSRASNLTINPSGRTLSGGLDPAALYRPRRFFGAARNIEEGGSLTIIATALVDTGSKMDDAIFEEFKGTGNMELVLDRDLAERRIWPAIDVRRSSTRHEEKLFAGEEALQAVYHLHRMLANAKDTVDATESLIKLLKRTPTNEAFLESVIAKTRATV